MPRPRNPRRVEAPPRCTFFKPRGVPMRSLEVVVLTIDELEALRLADRDGLYQEEAAVAMGVSRATFGRVLASAHQKVADALVGGKALAVEGGPVELDEREATPRPPSRGPGRGRRRRGWGPHNEGDDNERL